MSKDFGPRCPNHKCVFVDRSKGRGICPVSGVLFTYDEDYAEKNKKIKLNSLGQYEEVKDWQIQGTD